MTQQFLESRSYMWVIDNIINLHVTFYPVGIGVLLPNMTIHMKSLGISVEETAIIYGVFPIFSIFAPYAMGIIADKLGNFKVKLSPIR